MPEPNVELIAKCATCPLREVLQEGRIIGSLYVQAGDFVCQLTGKPVAYMSECPEELDQ